MSGLSFSPVAKLWFVGTDMGTLFRSTDEGKSWTPISHKETAFDSDLSKASGVGFSADPKVVFFARGGKNPKRSMNAGVNWQAISIPLEKEEFVRYWSADLSDRNSVYCATNQGLFRSADGGSTWKRSSGVNGDSQGTFVASEYIAHATSKGIFVSKNKGKNFDAWYIPEGRGIRGFAGGIDEKAMTFAFVDTDGASACKWVKYVDDTSSKQKEDTIADCGYVWVMSVAPKKKLDVAPSFSRLDKDAGRFIRMAENDSQTIYITGGNWARQYGNKVWVTQNAGKSWSLRLHLYDWDQRPYQPWPREKLEYSAVGLDVGWDDGVYPSFVVNPKNSAQAGGSGYYFVHVTADHGKTWKAPFTQFADKGEREKGKAWKSVGLEVTSVQKLKFHPKNTKIAYAGLADMGGLVSEDGGESWRISKVKYNTNYDYAFDPSDENAAFAASGSVHDFPLGNNSIIDGAAGGIFKTKDRGRTWTRLTPDNRDWTTQFLSVAYDSARKVIYGGTRGRGVGRSTDGGKTWNYFNDGLPESGKIIPQIEVDPQNGNIYLLLTGDAQTYSNQKFTGIYILNQSEGAKRWKLLRGKVQVPKGVAPGTQPWWFPSAFAVDFSESTRNVLWLTDIESKGSWLASGVWKSTDGGANWTRLKQFTHPTMVTIDRKNSDRVYISGLYRVDGSWGDGGAIYTTDGGLTWKKNENIPLLANLDGTVLDPNKPGQLFYLFFGGGMFYGPQPK